MKKNLVYKEDKLILEIKAKIGNKAVDKLFT